MKRIALLVMLLIILSSNFVFAHEHDFAETKQLIDSGISCDKLTDEQLEAIGDYYIEQMHPGEAHEIMDNMMGGEGSESLQQVHINMAKRIYCNENVGGMMGMMNMMGGNMMGDYPTYYSYGYNSFLNIFWLIFLIGLITLIIWIIYKFTRKEEESETPISILQKRYAKGKINKKQFEEMKKEIMRYNHGKR